MGEVEKPEGKPTMKDFFVSYTIADESAAEWVAYELEDAGYSVTLMKWDFSAGSNFVIDMQRAADACERILPILSPNYLQSAFTQPEWAVAFGKDPTGANGLLIPVRVKQCDIIEQNSRAGAPDDQR